MNIFVTNFSRSIDEEDLEIPFGDFGKVDEVNIWVDHEVKSIRFAIVQMPDDHDARKAIKKLDGKKIYGRRRLWVEEAPDAFGRLGEICNDASRNDPNSWRPVKYRPNRVSSS